eukprot:6838436-Pyramimonas_sp.AAC.1
MGALHGAPPEVARPLPEVLSRSFVVHLDARPWQGDCEGDVPSMLEMSRPRKGYCQDLGREIGENIGPFE